MVPAPKLFPVELKFIARLVDYTGAENLGRFDIVTATVGKDDTGGISVGSTVKPHDIGLGHQFAVFAVSTATRPGSAPQFCPQVIFQIELGRRNVAVAETHSIKEDNRSAA